MRCNGMDTLAVFNEYFAGATSGIAGLVVGYPFDTTKVQIQIQPSATQYKSAREAVLNIQRQGWSHGFFRGLSLPLISYGLVNSVFFGAYSHTLQALSLSSCPHYLAVYFAGCIGAMVSLIPAVPAEVVKVVLQSQIPRMPTAPGVRVAMIDGPLQTARAIVASRGVAGLYSGFTAQLLRDTPSGGVYFLTYNYLCDMITARLPAVPRVVTDFFAGGFAGVLSWFIVNPLDVIKSKMQTDYNRLLYRNFCHCASVSYREDGAKVFFRGALVNAIRAFPVNAAIFMTYSYTIRTLNGVRLLEDDCSHLHSR